MVVVVVAKRMKMDRIEAFGRFTEVGRYSRYES
jgi:hypothetical protein